MLITVYDITVKRVKYAFFVNKMNAVIIAFIFEKKLFVCDYYIFYKLYMLK